jgi:antirestriction protein
MCEFASWVEYDNKPYFLTNDDLDTKEGKKLLLPEVIADLCGHGAIRSYYPELKDKGIDKETICFSTPKNFPKEIVKAIKEGKLSRIGICLEVLNTQGKKEYKKTMQPAFAEYEKIEQPAFAEYEKIEQPALAEYLKIQQPAFAEYLKIQQPALAEYEKIKKSAFAEYEKIKKSAYAEYENKDQTAFTKIVKQKKYRVNEWK